MDVNNNLETWCKRNNREDLLLEWDYSANEGRRNRFKQDISKPNLIMYSSNIKVGWICGKGHHFEASPGNRTVNSRSCPYCAGTKLLTGYNDFETWCLENNRQDLLDEWDYEKNGIKPSEILRGGGGKKIWWKGKCGHEWDAVISSRTKIRQGKTKPIKTAGCPFCSNPPKRILKGFNDLESWCEKNHRDYILTEWNYEKNDFLPSEVSFGSGKSVWWKCNKNHEWKVPINGRTTGSKTNCPICCRTQTSFPEQAIAYYLMKKYSVLQRFHIKGREVDVLLPDYNIAIEYDGLRWHQEGDKRKKDFEKTQALIGAGVMLIRVRENAETNSFVVENGVYIISFIVNSGRYITKDFEWAIKELFKNINSITGLNEIPVIDIAADEFNIRAHYMNVLQENSVASVFPELINEWDVEKNGGVTPDSFSARNNKKVWWRCSKGHSWLASINTRGDRKLGCPYCAGQRVIYGKNDFESWCKENYLSLLSEWDYEKNVLKPSEIPKTFKEKVFWKCKKGHEWMATVYNRLNGTGCPICNTGNNTRRNRVSLEEWCKNNNSDLYKEWNCEKNAGKTPADYTYGSHEKVWWKCSKGHEWQAQIKSRTYNHGCPYCSSTNKRAIKGENDLETWCKENDREYLLEEWDYEKNGDLVPQMVTAGSHKRIFWKCKKGHSWDALVKERTKAKGNVCPICRKEAL